jgi:chromosome segregation ATPase
MSTTEYQFRGSAFGGFNRQDVMDYIERAAKEHSEQVENLQQALAAAEESRGELEAKLAEADQREARCTGENGELRQNLSEKTAALEAARADLERKSSALVRAEESLALLRDQVKELAPAAESYRQIKERTATIELEAHRRAQAILDDANAQSREKREEVEGWLRRVQSAYDRLRTDLDATLCHTAGELERVCRAMDGLSTAFAQQDEELKGLSERCREPKAPEPIPLKED